MSASAVGAGTPSCKSSQHAVNGSPDPQGHASLATALRYDIRVQTRADDLAKMTVLDESERPIELGTLWRDRTVVLVFIRHFG
jgi:hypothetical protein